jgi:hypothetical protein
MREQSSSTLRLASLAAGVAALLALAGSGCSAPDPNARFQGKFPDQATFKPVADMLIHRCASLDCHGQPGRNLKLYGVIGLRLQAGDTPSLPGPLGWASADEYAADYRSVVGLEPEVMTQVIDDGGKNPERLSLVAKPRNLQVHKGGTLMVPGDIQDKCLLSWLTPGGTVDTASCQASLKLP